MLLLNPLDKAAIVITNINSIEWIKFPHLIKTLRLLN
jgi:hypothetical protein